MALFRRRARVTLDLDDIQATVLRARPEPYVGTHALLEITDRDHGRRMMASLHERVESARTWDEPLRAWTAVCLSYNGLVALGVPSSSLETFPRNFREGMAARAGHLRDEGQNDPANWESPFGTGRIHVTITVYATDEKAWAEEISAFEARLAGFSGIRVLGARTLGHSRAAGTPSDTRTGLHSRLLRVAALKVTPETGVASQPGSSFSAIPPRTAMFSLSLNQHPWA